MTVNWTNITSAGDLLQVANTNTAGTFWNGILFMIMFVLFMALLAFGADVALMVSLFIGLMLGTALLYLGLVSSTVVGIIVGCLLFMIIYFMYSSRQNN